MRFTPRADEVAAIAAILDQDHASADAAAKAVLKEAAELLTMRDWFAVSHTWANQSSGVNVGVFASEADAKGLMDKLAPGGKAMIVKLHSSGQILAQVDGKKGSKEHCQDVMCAHPGWSHLASGSTRGACALPNCKCRAWQAPGK